MRQIKFRAWDSRKKRMLQDVAFHFNPQTGQFDFITDYGIGLYSAICEISDYPIMQFTGLLDKAGKEIYEGDVIEIFFPCRGEGDLPEVKEIKVVTFEDGGFTYEPGMYLGFHYPEVFTALGNIYEHKHLISEVK